MTTYTAAAQSPEARAAYEQLSPEARAFADHLTTWLDSFTGENQEMAKFGIDALLTACERQHDPQRQIAREADRVLQDARRKQFEDIPIGTIDGCAVTGNYTEAGTLFSAKVTWNGLAIYTDGTDYLNLTLGKATGGYKELDCVGDMHLWERGKIKELASTDVVEQLIALARARATYQPA